MNATVVPSGENCGEVSAPTPVVNRLASPPPRGAIQRLPAYEKTICVRLIAGWRISKGFSCARPPVEILMVEATSNRERIKIVFFMAMLPFNFYMLLSRDVVCSVMLDVCATFAVSTNCRPGSETGALYAAGNVA